ncbi:unnamed protein product [Triticum turgidum subsp. durum]|uniref:Oxidation resistance protein 1 n=1 Tax=Triticum turgidum subsp. durum TaxID=4567 RepID=A0A9R0Y5J7_TRITD|nr:unnamed protein product [Triticum turgidum subsp. durum]
MRHLSNIDEGSFKGKRWRWPLCIKKRTSIHLVLAIVELILNGKPKWTHLVADLKASKKRNDGSSSHQSIRLDGEEEDVVVENGRTTVPKDNRLFDEYAKKWLVGMKKEINECREYEAVRAAMATVEQEARMQPEQEAMMAAEQAAWMEADEEQEKSEDDKDSDHNSDNPDGPDTSSFRAFMISFLSPSSSFNDSREIIPEQSEEMGYPTLTPVGKTNKGKTGLLSRGKHSIGKIINKAARMSGFKQSSEPKIDKEVVNHAESVAPALELEGPNEVNSLTNMPVMSEPSVLLSETMRSTLYSSLPILAQGRSWVLLYSTLRHGISLSTLYRRSLLCPGYSLLVVGDRKGAVFGGLVEAPLQPTSTKKYQGTNNCFVFTNLHSDPAIYRPTGANKYYTVCSADYLALGGGGHFALYLDSDLLSGSSSNSETFNNQCLSHSPDFAVKDVELWGFVYPSRYEEMLKLCSTEKPGWNKLTGGCSNYSGKCTASFSCLHKNETDSWEYAWNIKND